ncbi:MAG: translation initiation factor IF-3 [Waddliaceae bacterium]|nr:translation initiation factor IF-3 [Candidatus Jacksonbacteria bacterium]MBT3579608.1 translation initiation factor IF-3 [Waddliaceae bacterium]MBT4444592.1 translation initiation factor IF-3 [Waddliaceae bacterium]MBT6928784.1 translation initiation factor IF-3 [Waddliaceae bacterium]
MRINQEIRAQKVRVIGIEGNQEGIFSIREAQALAEDAGADLVEIAPMATPPVCKIIDYGKYRYEQTRRERENKKSQHQIKVKEVKLKPNINDNDFQVKFHRAEKFLEKGNKVKVTCMFRGREMAHPEIGEAVVKRMCKGLEDLGTVESPIKRFGRTINVVIAPGSKKKPVNKSEKGE